MNKLYSESVMVASRQIGNFQLYHGENKLHFYEMMMMMMSAL